MPDILGSLSTSGGQGVIRAEHRIGAPAVDVWSAMTDPARLTHWYGNVAGDLRPGGEFTLFVPFSEWDGTGRIDTCETGRRLKVTTRQTDASWAEGEQPYEEVIDATLSADGDATVIQVEVTGLPLAKLPYYGAGWQENLESLAAYVEGGDPPGEDRFEQLIPAYLDQAAKL